MHKTPEGKDWIPNSSWVLQTTLDYSVVTFTIQNNFVERLQKSQLAIVLIFLWDQWHKIDSRFAPAHDMYDCYKDNIYSRPKTQFTPIQVQRTSFRNLKHIFNVIYSIKYAGTV